MDLLPRFRRALADTDRVKQGDRLVLGISGGPDSLVMLHLFVRLRDELALHLHAVHLNHRIRGEDADADARFVEAVAAEWEVPCRVEAMDVPALAAGRRLSLEEAARQARYTVLGRAAVELGARLIAVAHNADDQAETVLMHFLRGSGLAGLRGMLAATPLAGYQLLEPLDRQAEAGEAGPHLIRPLLDIPRADIEAYCTAHSLTPRFDRSNLDTTYFRNRLRHEVIPSLEALNPNLHAVLCRTASVAAADYEALQAQVDDAWGRIALEETSEYIRLDRSAWLRLPLAVQRAAIRRAVWRLRRSLRDVGYQHVEAAVRVARDGQTGAQATLPAGLALRVDYDALIITGSEQSLPEPDWPLLEPGAVAMIEGPGEVDLPGSAWWFSLYPYTGAHSGAGWRALQVNPWVAVLDIDRGERAPAVQLRTRQPGDRFRPQGAGGSQKVSEFQINAKIPAAWRDRLPLLVAGGEIAWVCGWRVDERFVVRPETERVWVARFERPGG